MHLFLLIKRVYPLVVGSGFGSMAINRIMQGASLTKSICAWGRYLPSLKARIPVGSPYPRSPARTTLNILPMQLLVKTTHYLQLGHSACLPVCLWSHLLRAPSTYFLVSCPGSFCFWEKHLCWLWSTKCIAACVLALWETTYVLLCELRLVETSRQTS